MNDGISIQKLIDQVRKELLEPTKVPEYPIFLVEKVELELAVAITEGESGEISISVLDTLSSKLGAEASHQRSHVIKVSLAPILTSEEIKSLIPEKIRDRINQATKRALVKGGDNNSETSLDNW